MSAIWRTDAGWGFTPEERAADAAGRQKQLAQYSHAHTLSYPPSSSLIFHQRDSTAYLAGVDVEAWLARQPSGCHADLGVPPFSDDDMCQECGR